MQLSYFNWGFSNILSMIPVIDADWDRSINELTDSSIHISIDSDWDIKKQQESKYQPVVTVDVGEAEIVEVEIKMLSPILTCSKLEREYILTGNSTGLFGEEEHMWMMHKSFLEYFICVCI